jgi:hypothetical protein
VELQLMEIVSCSCVIHTMQFTFNLVFDGYS